MSSSDAARSTYLSTGTPGLDEILMGGLSRDRMYLFEGGPGCGKTTLAMRFLLAGAEAGEACLYVTLSETADELRAVASAHGWSLDKVDLYELTVGESGISEAEENTLYVPAEVELGERIRALLEVVDRVNPTRIVIDSCSELRLLAQSPLRFRRQLLALKQLLVRRHCTVLLIENPMGDADVLLQSLVHGVVLLEQSSPQYGAERRRLRVLKMRERAFRGGYHDMIIRHGGVEVFPRLVAAEHGQPFAPQPVSSGIPELDALLRGGIERGTSTLLMGPSGSGKSAIAMQYVTAAAERGDKAAIFVFDEGLEILLARADLLGMPLRAHHDAGRVRLQQVDPAEMTTGEFSRRVRTLVEDEDIQVVVIDSLNGYMLAMHEERFMTAHLHELLTFLRRQGVLTLMVMVQHGLVGETAGPVDLSYVADTVVLTRYFEASGRVRKAISVVKKRSGDHEDTIREFSVGEDGVKVGQPLTGFRGVLSGVPTFEGTEGGQLLSTSEARS